VQDLWVKVERVKLEAVEPLFLKVVLLVDQKRWMEVEDVLSLPLVEEVVHQFLQEYLEEA